MFPNVTIAEIFTFLSLFSDMEGLEFITLMVYHLDNDYLFVLYPLLFFASFCLFIAPVCSVFGIHANMTFTWATCCIMIIEIIAINKNSKLLLAQIFTQSSTITFLVFLSRGHFLLRKSTRWCQKMKVTKGDY